MSLGLLGLAPKLLSKDVQSEISDNIEEFKSSVVTLTMLQVGDVGKILDKDLVWIMKPSKDNDGTYIPVIEGYVNSRVILLGGIAKVEVVVLRQMSKFSNDGASILYHVTNAGEPIYYHRRLAIERIEG